MSSFSSASYSLFKTLKISSFGSVTVYLKPSRCQAAVYAAGHHPPMLKKSGTVYQPPLPGESPGYTLTLCIYWGEGVIRRSVTGGGGVIRRSVTGGGGVLLGEALLGGGGVIRRSVTGGGGGMGDSFGL